MVRIIIVCLVGCVCGLFAKKMGVPGGPIVGAMLGSGLAAATFSGQFVMPEHVSTTIQIMLGISLGITCDRSSLYVMVKVFPFAILSTLALLCCAVLMAWIASKTGTINFATALFGFSPGGMSGMGLLAQSEGLQMSTVAMMHIVRIFLLFLMVPVLSRVLSVWLKT